MSTVSRRDTAWRRTELGRKARAAGKEEKAGTGGPQAAFESAQVVEQVRRRQPPAFVYAVRATAALETFRMPW